MSFNNELKDVMGGYNPHNVLLDSSRKLVEKWEPTGLLEGIEKESDVAGMAVLLENQAKQLIDEASQVGTSANQEQWSGVALPLVRRIFAELSAQEFVSVQPMNLPSGLIFYLDFKYGSTQNSGLLHAKDSDLYGNTSSSGDPSGGLYGAGKWGYSVNDTKTSGVTFATGSVSVADIRGDANLSASQAAGSLVKVLLSGSAALTNPDLEGVKSFAISGSGTAELTAFYPAFTSYDDSVDVISFIVDPAGAIVPGTIDVNYGKQPADTTRGDFETSFAAEGSNPEESNAGIPEVDIQMRSVAITAKTRKLKAVWTPELAQDLNAYHAVDAEAELTAMLSEYVTMEVDMEIIDMLKLNASAKTEYWSAEMGFEWNGSAFAQTSANVAAYTKGEWFQTLGNKIQSVSNAIHKKTLRGGANFIVISPEVATILESIPGFATDSDGDATKSYAMGVQKIGALNNRFNVYKNPYLQDDQILCGFRGAQFLETGAVYAPYVPMILTPVVYDPTNFTPRRGVMTRYAKKMVRPEFYGLVNVAKSNLV
ncbi:MAG: hypothetical protein CMB47_07300 [Euryarchaeota archaeon]|nr:hypothetical protein [Euryarchaeota archaeon]|tara:strand:+ start:59 stop:1675 length:1617 start_codon:yes stop_codon:yes gene_type:complete